MRLELTGLVPVTEEPGAIAEALHRVRAVLGGTPAPPARA
jgi:hypothetical protein